MSITLTNFDKCCRCCLSIAGPFQPLFSTGLDMMLQDLVSTKINEAGAYPQQMCRRCVLKLSAAYNFKQTILKSYEIIRNVLQASGHLKYQQNEFETMTNELIIEQKVEWDNTDIKNDLLMLDNNQDKAICSDIRAFNIKEEIDRLDKDDTILYKDRYFPLGDTEDNGNSNNEKEDQDLNDVNNEKSSACSKHTNSSVHETIAESAQEPKTEKKNLKCTHCTTYFLNKVDLKEHISTHNESCKVCDKIISRANKARHMRTHFGVKPFVCEICDKRFAEKSNLTKHLKGHLGEPRRNGGYLCSQCGKEFKWKTSLYKHLRYHTGKFYSCHVCGRGYTDSSYLKIHMSLGHSKDGDDSIRHKCDKCKSTFSQLSALTKHKLVHSQTRPRFQCGDCRQTFLHKFTLARHRRFKHSTEQTIYKCSDCDKEFNSVKSLRNHSRLHKRTVKKSIAGRDNERTVMEFNSNAPTGFGGAQRIYVEYLCLCCKLQFCSQKELESHKCTPLLKSQQETVNAMPLPQDTEPQTFDCKICDLTFPNGADLVDHYQTSHNFVTVNVESG